MREYIARAPFRIHIALSPTEVATRTVVRVYRDFDVHELRFHGGARQDHLRQDIRQFATELALMSGRSWSPSNHQAPTGAEIRRFQNAAEALFSAIFRHNDPDIHRRIRDDLSFYLNHKNLNSIIFDSPTMPGIPVDALFYGTPGGNVDHSRYLGARAPILHSPRPDKDYFEGEEATLLIGFLGTNLVEAVERRDHDSIFAVFERLEAKALVQEFTPLRGSDDEPMEVADLPALFRTFAQARSVWHITSHMEERAGRPVFILDNGLEVRADYFSAQHAAGRLLGQPLVFLNLCTGTQPGLVSDENFPDNLHGLNAGGVIATHSLVNGRFATHFAERFYTYAFGDDLTVGESLFRARQDSLAEDGSLASLAYSFHALEDFSLPALPGLASRRASSGRGSQQVA